MRRDRRALLGGFLGIVAGSAAASIEGRNPEGQPEFNPARDRLTIGVWLSGITPRQEQSLCEFMRLSKEQPDLYELIVFQVMGNGLRAPLQRGHDYPCFSKLGDQEIDFFGRLAEKVGLTDIPGVVIATEGYMRKGPLEDGIDILRFTQSRLGLR